MKKRIGSKLYDTDTAILIIPEQNLYRTQKNQTYFLFDGNIITPLDFEEAENIIKKYGSADLINMLKRKPNKKGQISVMISPSSADRLSAYCRRHKTSQKKVVEELIDTLPDD